MNLITTIMTKINNPDEYYQRSEVSNSDLTELKNLLHPHMQFGDKEAAFRFGSIVDAIITEPSRVDFLHMTIDGEQCSEEEFRHAREMQRALRAEADETNSSLRFSNMPIHNASWSTSSRSSAMVDLPSIWTHAANGTGGCQWPTSAAI